MFGSTATPTTATAWQTADPWLHPPPPATPTPLSPPPPRNPRAVAPAAEWATWSPWPLPGAETRRWPWLRRGCRPPTARTLILVATAPGTSPLNPTCPLPPASPVTRWVGRVGSTQLCLERKWSLSWRRFCCLFVYSLVGLFVMIGFCSVSEWEGLVIWSRLVHVQLLNCFNSEAVGTALQGLTLQVDDSVNASPMFWWAGVMWCGVTGPSPSPHLEPGRCMVSFSVCSVHCKSSATFVTENKRERCAIQHHRVMNQP